MFGWWCESTKLFWGKDSALTFVWMPNFPKTCPGSHRDQDEIWHRLFGKCGFESLCCINPYIHNLIGMSKFEPMASLAMSLIYNQKSFLEKITPNFDPQHWELLSCKCKLWIGCGQRFVICIASILNVCRKNGFCSWKPDNSVILAQFFNTICSSELEIPDKSSEQKLTLFLHAVGEPLELPKSGWAKKYVYKMIGLSLCCLRKWLFNVLAAASLWHVFSLTVYGRARSFVS